MKDAERGKRQHWCRACFKIVSQGFYKVYKPKVLARNDKNRKLIAALVREAKERPCADCGQRYPSYVMDLDHRPGSGKKFILAHARTKGMKQALAELAKCEAVCANCHRERTFGGKREKRTTVAS